MRIRTDTNGRDETLRMLMQATGEATKTGALFAAAEHYLHDKRNKEGIEWERYQELAGELSTGELPIHVEVNTRVGHENE